MDKIKLDFTYCSDADYEDRYKSTITIIVNENSNIAKLIAKEKRVLSNGEIGFVSSFCMEPESLLKILLERSPLGLVLRYIETGGFHLLDLSWLETQNSIIWNNTLIPKRDKFPLFMGFPIDENFPKKIKTSVFHFEFDKKQYYQALSDFIDKMLDSPNCDKDYVIPVVNVFNAKKINSERLNEVLLEENEHLFYKQLSKKQLYQLNEMLSEEKYYLLEDFLLPKRKNDIKQLKTKLIT